IVKAEMPKDWTKRLASRIEGISFEVGILENKVHLEAKHRKLSNYAGGPIRMKSRQSSDKTIGEVFVDNMERMNVDLLREPFQKQSADIIKFTKEFFRYVCKSQGANERRINHLLQAIVRNPIL